MQVNQKMIQNKKKSLGFMKPDLNENRFPGTALTEKISVWLSEVFCWKNFPTAVDFTTL